MKGVSKSLLDVIGHTPLLSIDGIFVKAEFLNPSGSVKDRIALYMVEQAEKEGRLKKGYTIVEASTGNTGTALAMVGALKGYQVIIYIPKGLTQERYKMIKAFGAELRFVPKHSMATAVEKARSLGMKSKHFHVDQFSNPYNPKEHEKFMGKEIINQLHGEKVDLVVNGIGSGGTLIGLAKAFKKHNPRVKVFGVEPVECAVTYEHMHNLPKVCKPHRIEGIADNLVPPFITQHAHLLDGIMRISSKDAITESHRIAREHGCFVGVCSGANLLAAKKLKKKYKCKTVVTLFTDEGEKYLSEKWFSGGQHG
jgi:cysteine synthase